MSDKLRNLLRLLGTALSRLDLALAQPVNEFVRASAIQRFEFTLATPATPTTKPRPMPFTPIFRLIRASFARRSMS